MSEPPVPAELAAAYQAAIYQVGGERPFRLELGRRCAALIRLYRRTGCDCALFITACNPASRPTDRAANGAAQARLAAELARLSPRVLEGQGLDPQGQWPPEASLLALGIDAAAARALGARYGQNAVVWAGVEAVPRLLWCRPMG